MPDDEDMTDDGAETAELDLADLALIPDDADADDTPYGDDFNGVQDPAADPQRVDMAETRAKEGGDDA